MFERIYSDLEEAKIVAVIRTNTYEEAEKISLAAIDGGIKVIEITMSVPNAPKLINVLKNKHKEVYIGAGTVLTKNAVDECIDNGADFLVSPCIDEDVITYASQRKILIVPGVMTISELNNAYKLGLRFVKVFPGDVVGKEFIGAAKSIFPDIRIMPTGGVNKNNIDGWLKAGSICTGIGSVLNKVYKAYGFEGIKEYCNEIINKANNL